MKRKNRLSQAERTTITRNALIGAAAEIVGERGYKDASVVLICQRAGVASGTFYNYFETRQALFDILLPTVGGEILERIQEQVGPDATGSERERLRYRAYTAYCRENPGFNRLLDEAVVYAPRAFVTHVQRFASGYGRALRRSLIRGELRDFSEDEIPALVFMFMGARAYFNLLNIMPEFAPLRPSAANLEDTYMKVLEHGIFSSSGEG